jgi:hypothetical protein
VEGDVLVSSWRNAVFEADVAHAGSAAVFSATIPSFCPERANKLPVRLGEGGFRHPERLACFAQRSAQGPEGNDDLIRQSTIQSPYQRISAGLEQPLIFFSVPFDSQASGPHQDANLRGLIFSCQFPLYLILSFLRISKMPVITVFLCRLISSKISRRKKYPGETVDHRLLFQQAEIDNLRTFSGLRLENG